VSLDELLVERDPDAGGRVLATFSGLRPDAAAPLEFRGTTDGLPVTRVFLRDLDRT
jgi:hypothetical protein